jgi:Cd2+/Zn2+-exporting ATPase
VDTVQPADGVTREQLLAAASALGARSFHPVDRAIAAYARQKGDTPAAVADVRALPGQGIEGVVEGEAVLLGSRRFFAERGLMDAALHAAADALEARGMTVSFVARHGRALGIIGLTDELRVHGREAIEALREAGVSHVALLSGDHARSVRAAGEAGQVDAIEAGLLPQDKVALVGEMRSRHGLVAMVGDGVNDAPALAAADVGIAMGVAGTDAAIETADVALMSDDLRAVPFAIRLGRATLATIRANVAAALVIKIAFVSLAIAGVATLWMAVAADMGASFLVVANALRLLRVR